MQKITPCLWFNHNGEEAIAFYSTIFKDVVITSRSYYPAGSPGPEGKLMTACFEMEGQEYIALNGGPDFKFNEAISLTWYCDTQEELDEKWQKLLAGGQAQQCGWLKDKFGLCWQIVPRIMNDLMQDKDPEKTKRVMDAMLKMVKLDIQKLKDAYNATGTK